MIEHVLPFWNGVSLTVFGVLSGVLSALCFMPYIRDTVRGQTRPARASWLIWSVLGAIAFFTQISEGINSSLWFVSVQVGGTILVCLLSVWRGEGTYLTRKNKIVLLIASAGLVAWYLTDSAVYALLLSISIGLLAGSVTIYKCFLEPQTETLSTWMMALAASVFAVLSVGSLNWVLLVYPLYLLALYVGIVGALLLGRARQKYRMVQSEVSCLSVTGAVFMRSAYRSTSHSTTSAPEGQIFGQVEEFATQKDMQIPIEYQQVEQHGG